MTQVPLHNQRLIAVTGADRVSFLQGQLTQDMSLLAADTAMLTGGADAKGRLQFSAYAFTLRVQDDEAIALVVPAELAEALIKRLQLYVLRAKVQLALSDQALIGVLGGGPSDTSATVVQLPGSGDRRLLLGTSSGALSAATSFELDNTWELAELRAGMPTIVRATAGQFVPQMVNLDLLGGISFTKGCYTGQEIVARMKYLGRVKRRMLRFSADGPPPPAGTALHAARGTAGHGTVGQVVRSAATPAGCEFLAVVSLDELPDPVFLDEAMTHPAHRQGLPYDIPL